MLAVEAEGVPVELTNLDRWCLWRLTTRDGKSTKQPFQTSGEPAKSNDPATWDTFDSVVAEYARRPGHWSGIGFVFSADDPFCGIDLDGCRNATTGELAPWAKRIVDHFATYSEISPSGTGVKLWVIGQWRGSGHKKILAGLPLMADKQPAIEVYDSLRYFAVTGRSLAEGGGGSDHVTADQAGLDLIHEQFFAASERPKKATSAVTTGTSSSPQGQGRDVLINRASAYLAKVPPSISGQDGSGAALRAACELFRFGLTDGEARDLFDDFNARCQPPWSDHEIDHKLESARDKVVKDGEFGTRVSQLGEAATRSRSPRKRSKSKSRPQGKPATEISFPILAKLQSVERESATAWKANCPLCYGQSTLSVSLDGSGGANKAEVLCSAGCDPIELLIAAGCLQSDLYVELVPIKTKEPAANQPSAGQANEADDDPHRLANLFLTQRHAHNGDCTLRLWRDEWWTWKESAYRETPLGDLRAKLTQFIKTEFDRLNVEALKNWNAKDDDDLEPQTKKVTVSLVTNVMAAMASVCLLAREEQPFWIDGNEEFPPDEILSTQKQLIHVRSLTEDKPSIFAPTPQFFTLNAVDYDFDPEAACPHWLKFLEAAWSGDQQSIESLQEWFGYLLLPDSSQDKILMVIGPTRSGKGTIIRVLTKLLGEVNVASPRLSSLAQQFGLQSLLTKTAALIPDARLNSMTDPIAVVETLLSISGQDRQDVQRKHLPTVTSVRMKCRFVLVSNELPNLKDSSGAFLARIILLRMQRSHLGSEDTTLTARLLAELPGILNWSIEGWQRLQERGKFLQPDSGEELIDEFRPMTSPISRFIEECCETGSDQESTPQELFDSWKRWCAVENKKWEGDKANFCKNLLSVNHAIRITKPRKGDGKKQVRIYQGISPKFFVDSSGFQERSCSFEFN